VSGGGALREPIFRSGPKQPHKLEGVYRLNMGRVLKMAIAALATEMSNTSTPRAVTLAGVAASGRTQWSPAFLETAFLLRAVMFSLCAPAHYGLLVTPSRQREQLTFGAFTFEPFIVDEAVDRFQPRLQKLGEISVLDQ
jgi:hypothetical protein